METWADKHRYVLRNPNTEAVQTIYKTPKQEENKDFLKDGQIELEVVHLIHVLVSIHLDVVGVCTAAGKEHLRVVRIHVDHVDRVLILVAAADQSHRRNLVLLVEVDVPDLSSLRSNEALPGFQSPCSAR